MEGFMVTDPKRFAGPALPTGPEYATPHIGFLFIAPRFAPEGPTVGALDFLQTPPHDNALFLSLTFGSANTWYEDFHLAS